MTPLKREREKRGLTTAEVALAVGITQPTLTRIENSQNRASPAVAILISNYFGNLSRDQILFPEYYQKGSK